MHRDAAGETGVRPTGGRGTGGRKEVAWLGMGRAQFSSNTGGPGQFGAFCRARKTRGVLNQLIIWTRLLILMLFCYLFSQPFHGCHK